MAALLCKIYRYAPHDADIPTQFATDLAADGVTQAKLQAFEKAVVRGEIVYTVLHIA